MRTVESEDWSTMGEASCTGTITDKQATKLVVIVAFDKGFAVKIGLFDIGAVFGQLGVHVFVSTVVGFECAILGPKRFNVTDFNAKLLLDIAYNVYRTVGRLLLQFVGNQVGNVLCRGHFISRMVNPKASMFGVVRSDTKNGCILD